MYMSAKEASLRWGVSDRRIRVLCSGGKIPGACREGRVWKIPANAQKPADGRFRAGQAPSASAEDRQKAPAVWDRDTLSALFDRYIRKLRITPAWDVKLEFVDDPAWRKSGDFRIDCDDRKAILLLNTANPAQENPEEVIVHELMHIKMYPLDQVTESLIANCFEEGSAAAAFAYQQFFTTLEQTVEELAKCFLLEFGENRSFSYGRCRRSRSFNELYDGLKNLE